MEIVSVILGALVAILFLGFAFDMIAGRPTDVNRYIQIMTRWLRRALIAVGRQGGKLAQKHPLAAGIIIVIVLFYLLSHSLYN